MGVKIKTRFILTVMLCLLCSVGYAQKKDPLKELSDRVKNLEGQKENLDKLGEILKEKFNNETVSLNNKFLEQKRKLEDEYNYLKVFFWIVGPLTVIGIFTMAITMLISYFKLRKKLEKIAEEKIQKKFDQIFEEKKIQIEAMIDKQDEEFQLKKEKRILVLAPAGSNNSFLKRFFNAEGFNKVESAPPENVSNINLNDFHVVLLDNEDNKFGKGLIPSIVKGSKEVVFVYFGHTTEDSKAIQNEKNVAFANYRAQLYGNLINALRYQKYLKER